MLGKRSRSGASKSPIAAKVKPEKIEEPKQPARKERRASSSLARTPANSPVKQKAPPKRGAKRSEETETEESEVNAPAEESASEWSPSVEDASKQQEATAQVPGRIKFSKAAANRNAGPSQPDKRRRASAGAETSRLPPPQSLGPPTTGNVDMARLRELIVKLLDQPPLVDQEFDQQSTPPPPAAPQAQRPQSAPAKPKRGAMSGRAMRKPVGGRGMARPLPLARRGGKMVAPRGLLPTLMPAMNQNEPVAVQAVGAKVGQPYTGRHIMPEEVSSSVFTLKSGPSRAPILFVLAPNIDQPGGGGDDFDFAHLNRIITSGGGMVLASLDGLPTTRLNLNVAPGLAFCVATKPNESAEFLFGIAYGARCIYPTWVMECAESGRILDHSDYLLPAGQDLFGKRILQHRRRMIFGGRKMVVACASSLTSARLAKVLIAAGATAAGLTGDPSTYLDSGDESRLAEAAYIVVDRSQPPEMQSPLVQKVQQLGKTFTTVEWLTQSLMVGRVIEPGCNEAFTLPAYGTVKCEAQN